MFKDSNKGGGFGGQAPEVVADLDALAASDLAIRYKGETHTIKPLSTAAFFQLYASWARLDEQIRKPETDPQAAFEAISGIVSSIIPSLSRDEILQMNQAQVGALLNSVFRLTTGEKQAEVEHKKKTKAPAHPTGSSGSTLHS
jgi:hypothetical protein